MIGESMMIVSRLVSAIYMSMVALQALKVAWAGFATVRALLGDPTAMMALGMLAADVGFFAMHTMPNEREQYGSRSPP